LLLLLLLPLMLPLLGTNVGDDITKFVENCLADLACREGELALLLLFEMGTFAEEDFVVC